MYVRNRRKTITGACSYLIEYSVIKLVRRTLQETVPPSQLKRFPCKQASYTALMQITEHALQASGFASFREKCAYL